MKTKIYFLLLWIVLCIATLLSASAARIQPIQLSGRVVDEQQQPIAYATVVLLRDGEQTAGQTTDAEGRFVLKALPQRCTLSVQYLGCEPLEQALEIAGDRDLGDLVLHASTEQIEGVVVTGQLIRREADRFVVDVANAPSAIGKDGIELLEFAPGIWIDDEKITINGKSGSVVYVNDRRLRMGNDQLLAYLRSLRAEDIQKIEVVPLLGADHDASSSGGAIYITLRKQRDNGLTGSISFSTEHGSCEHSYTPGGRISAHSGRFDFNLSLYGQSNRSGLVSDESTTYTGSEALLRSHSSAPSNNPWWSTSAGIIWEITPKQSLGIEFDLSRWKNEQTNDAWSELQAGDALTRTDSRYVEIAKNRNYSTNFNYIWKLDTLGSTFKVLADYTRRTNNGDNDRFSRIAAGGTVRDSLYRDGSANRYDIVSATLALEKRFSSRWTLKAGAKYTYDRMDNTALYEYEQAGSWLPNEAQSYAIDYTEQIAALYGIVSAKLERWSLVAGLRGEYTHTSGKQGVGQDYASLFPNANISYALTADGAYSLIVQYARTIHRPGFWNLTPQRSILSDYLYQIGNPYLKPNYDNDLSATIVLKHKYSFTAGMTHSTDNIEQIVRPEAEHSDVLCLTWINWNRAASYYASANLPVQLTKWWQANVNLTYRYFALRERGDEAMSYKSHFFGNAAMTFTLPAKCYIDLSYRLQGRIELGQTSVDPIHFVGAGIKKQFGENWRISFRVNNLYASAQHVTMRDEGFVRRMQLQQPWTARSYAVSLTYTFKSGQAFRQKSVESETGEKGRL